jgi:hypothetical protein
MTEAQWLTSINPVGMLEHLRGKIGDRKARLLACAFARRASDLLCDVGAGEALDCAERFADGLATRQELLCAWQDAASLREATSSTALEHWQILRRTVQATWNSRIEVARVFEEVQHSIGAEPFASIATDFLLRPSAEYERKSLETMGLSERQSRAAITLLDALITELGDAPHGPLATALESARITSRRACAALLASRASWYPDEDLGPLDLAESVAKYAIIATSAGEAATQAGLIRCIIGNPFRPTISSMCHAEGAIKELAARIYQERSFASMVLLSEILEKNGCSDAEVLAHCRWHSHHALGCWCLDLLLDLDQGGRLIYGPNHAQR